MYSREECKKLLIECGIIFKNNRYKASQSIPGQIKKIQNLKESIDYYTSLVGETFYNTERWYWILYDVKSTKELPRCICGNICEFSGHLDFGYKKGCCREHNKIVKNTIIKEYFKNFKEDFSSVLSKEEIIKLYQKDSKLGNSVFLNKNKLYQNIILLNSLLFYTKDIIPINYKTIINTSILRQRLYHILNNIFEIPLCETENCNKLCNFQDIKHGYRKHCCISCVNKDKKVRDKNKETLIKTWGSVSAFASYRGKLQNNRTQEQKEITDKKRRKTNLKKYGVEYILSSKEIQKKQKETMLERYGVEHSSHYEPTIQKRKNKFAIKTKKRIKEKEDKNLKIYGTIKPSKKQKSKRTRKIRYGNENYNNIEKQKQTILERYGVPNSFLIHGAHGYSKISQELFWKIYKKLSNELKQNCYFYELNKEYFLSNGKGKTFYSYDFTIKNIKFIIEFNGVYWHTSKERDMLKNKFAEDRNFFVLTIWDNIYIKDKEKIINFCLKEIKKRNNNYSSSLVTKLFY